MELRSDVYQPNIPGERPFHRRNVFLLVKKKFRTVGPSGAMECRPCQDDVNRLVIVVGAGMAGIAAARHLRRHGQEVLVLEARERIGGRIWTHKMDGGVCVDMGAAWVHHHTEKNPLWAEVKSYGVETMESPVNGEGDIVGFDARGKRMQSKTMDKIDKAWNKLLAASETWAERLDEDCSLWEVIKHKYNDSMFTNTITLSSYMGADLDELSAWNWDEGEELLGGDVYFPHGYMDLLGKMADGINVRLGDPVLEIVDDGDCVTLRTRSQTYVAAAVIVAVPLGVLKCNHIDFSPPLPEAHCEAVKHIGYGCLNKVVLRFPHVFWDARAVWISYYPTPGHRTFNDVLNLARLTGKPFLAALSGGSFGRSFAERSDQDIVNELMGVLRTIYPGAPDPVEHFVTRWNSDPYAGYGSYCFGAVGSTMEHHSVLASPISKRLTLAGEHTCTAYPSYVHGALRSGVRAADQILGVK